MKISNSIAALLIVLLLTGYGATKYRVDRRMKERKAELDIRYLPSKEMAKVLSFGFEPAGADLYWIEGLNYFGSELINKKRTYQYLGAYIDLIAALDPNFAMFYDWASTTFIYNGQEITRKNIRNAVKYANLGIENLNKVHRFNHQMMIKNAFNFALEMQAYKESIDYFLMAARSFPEQRDMLLVASTYALHAKNPKLSVDLKLEYLGYIAFEAQVKEQLLYALKVLSSTKTHERTGEFVRALRLKMESEEDVRKIVEARLKDSPLIQGVALANQEFSYDPKIKNVLSIDFSRTWMPPEMLVLFSI